jgi:hypothetical protein
MSITDRSHTTAVRATDVDPTTAGGRRTGSLQPLVQRETKPSPKTTELWLTLVGVAVLAVVYNASRDASLDLFRACLLGTIVAAAYIVSRGFAKAGSRDDRRHADTGDRA